MMMEGVGGGRDGLMIGCKTPFLLPKVFDDVEHLPRRDVFFSKKKIDKSDTPE